MMVFPPLEPAVEAALRTSIARFGVLVPACRSAGPWNPGALLDGNNRTRIANELGVAYDVVDVPVADEAEAEEIARTLNLDRRHLDRDQRREIVAALRAEGHSLRAIAGAVGVDDKTVRNDLAATGADISAPGEVHGKDGKTYPARRPPAASSTGIDYEREAAIEYVTDQLVDALSPDDECGPHCDYDCPHLERQHWEIRAEAEAIVDTVAGEHEELTNEILDDAVAENVDSKRTPRPANKTDLGGVSHPARFTSGLIPLFAEFLEDGWRVLDPFAGTGKIHELRQIVDVDTVGVEIEKEWAELSDRTIIGNALDLPFPDRTFDAIVTSPTYGNRLADHHDAYDPEARRTYRHDLGRPLSEDNSGQLQWGETYREFHRNAWREATRVLRPGGVFVLNIKDHIRGGSRQPVSAWHALTLLALGYCLVDCVPFTVTGYRNGANHLARLNAELVWVFQKGEDDE